MTCLFDYGVELVSAYTTVLLIYHQTTLVESVGAYTSWK